ncbi:hypothetical protein MRX96_022942 [Rhipicephalus microplus]
MAPSPTQLDDSVARANVIYEAVRVGTAVKRRRGALIHDQQPQIFIAIGRTDRMHGLQRSGQAGHANCNAIYNSATHAGCDARAYKMEDRWMAQRSEF